ncbi:translation initiation factor, partial [Streptomyces sviceus ATCC 29083]
MGWSASDQPRYGLHTFNTPADKGQTDRMADQYVQSGEDSKPTEIPAIRWEEPPEGPVLVLLDQTRLPAEEVELVCTDASALVEAIRSLAVRG